MRTAQTTAETEPAALVAELSGTPNLLLAFGPVGAFEDTSWLERYLEAFPGLHVAGCSTAGNITAEGVNDETLTLTWLRFDVPGLQVAVQAHEGAQSSREVGLALGQQLDAPGLHHVLLLGLGTDIDGTALVEGLECSLDDSAIRITGGLAGDGGAFLKTYTLSRQGASDRAVVAVGISSPTIKVSQGCFGGWAAFGPTRRVTRIKDNILYELDGEPALEVYQRYLGEYAKDLPSTGLLFPFKVVGTRDDGVIRTILGIDEKQGSLLLAGQVRKDALLQLMHSNADELVDGAITAAEQARTEALGETATLLVSCVGRKLVMGDRVEEEVEAVGEVLLSGAGCIAGFYSYGEVSQGNTHTRSVLHNQTMTITHIYEAA